MLIFHFSKNLRKMGIKVINAFMLVSVVLSNATGIVQARGVQEQPVQPKNASVSGSAKNTYEAPVFTHHEPRIAGEGIRATSATPIGNWKFDEGSGTTAIDTGSEAHNGTINGAAAWINGRYFDSNTQPSDYALQFNGTNTYVGVTDAFDPTAYTVAAWVKPTTVNRNIFVRTDANGPTASFSHNIYVNSIGQFCANTYDGVSKTVCGTTVVNTAAPRWYHVATTASNSGQLKLYVNGIQEGTPGNIGPLLWIGGDRYYIGSNRNGLGYFQGAMDDVRLYNSELSPADILALYAADQSIIDVPAVPVIADNVNAATIQLTLKDGAGNILPNHALAPSVSGTGNTITPATAQTDINGAVAFTVKSTKAETKTITVFDQTQSVLLEAKPTITFISGSVSAQKSTVTANFSNVKDNGVDISAITVTALDEYNNPISGTIVNVTTTGSAVVTQPGAVTDAQGKAVATIADAVMETVAVSAQINNAPVLQTASVRFHCRTDGDLMVVSGDTCTFNAGIYTFNNVIVRSSGTLILKGDTTSDPGIGVKINAENVTVETGGKISADGMGYVSPSTWNACGGGPGGGSGAGPGGGGGHGGIGGENSTTTCGGHAGITYDSVYLPVMLGSAGGNRNGYSGGSGGGAIWLNVNGTLAVNGVISANGNDGAGKVPGGGAGGSILINVETLSGSGAVQARGGHGAINVAYGDGGGGGGGRIAVYANGISPTIQFLYTGNFVDGQSGTLYLGIMDPSNSTLTASPSSVIADGSSVSTITVTLNDANGDPVPNRAVDLALASGSGVVIKNQSVDAPGQYVTIGNTDANGVVVAMVKTTIAGTRTFKARSGQELIVQQGSVEFVAGPASGTTSLVTSSPASTPANGQSQITITVTVYDSNHNPVEGANVVLASTGNASVMQPTAPTNNLGKTTGKITNATAETVTISAIVNGSAIQDTADLNFTGTDLKLAVAVPASAVSGTPIPYTTTLKNVSALAAQGTELTIQLPANVTYISQNSTVTPVINGQTLTWDFGTLDPSQQISFILSGQVSPQAVVGEVIELQGNATSSTGDTTPGNNAALAKTTVIEGHDFVASIAPASKALTIGGTSPYTVTLKNTGVIADQYTLGISGLDAQWYALEDFTFSLLPGETRNIPLTISTSTCSAAGSHPFTVNAASAETGTEKTVSANVTFDGTPGFLELTPANGSTLGSRDVTIAWQTDAPTTGKVTVYPQGLPGNALTFTTASNTHHAVVAPNLTRNTTYVWQVEATGECGTKTSSQRAFTVGNGIVFTNRSQSFTIDRDYNQIVSVALKNTDSVSHTLTSSITEGYDDLIVNFVDGGSADQTVTLTAGETRNVTLAIHTQDATQSSYDLTASLTADDKEDTPIQDNMTIHVNVLSEGNYTIIEDTAAFDPLTLARMYVITNNGKAISDLSLDAVDPVSGLPASVYMQPSLDHARIETGQSIRVKVYPVFGTQSAGNLQSKSSGGARQAAPAFTVADIPFTLQTEGAGVKKSAAGSISCPGGKSITPVEISACTMTFKTGDTYCTNRPLIIMPFQSPAVQQSEIASIYVGAVYTPQGGVRPHNGQTTFNGAEVYSFSDSIPRGLIISEAPVRSWQEGAAGSVTQELQLSTQHPNGGHYQVATGFQLDVNVDSKIVYVCAGSAENAQQIVDTQYDCKAGSNLGDISDESTNFSGGDSGSAGGSTGPTDDVCAGCLEGTQGSAGDPINTKSGAFSITLSDLSFPTAAGELIFQRSYSSGAINTYTSPLGYGWTFNHDSKLILSDSSNGAADFVLFQIPSGNQYLFKLEADGSYKAFPGVTASLVKSSSAYTITTSQQKTFIFDLNGQLVSRADEQGHAFTYLYDAHDRLVKISADNNTRYIQISYDASNRIESVNDHTGRHVTYGYNAAGDLVAATDVLGRSWVFVYDSGHHLTQIKDPSGLQTLKTDYDIKGRAYRQYDGNGNLLANIVYNANRTSTLYNALGQAELHAYDDRNALVGTTNPMGALTSKTYDDNFRPQTITDEEGNTTTLVWSADGRSLISVADAQGNQTRIMYNALNKPTAVTDAQGHLTTFKYDGALLTSTTNALNQTMTYAYTSEGYLKSAIDPLGHATSYTYDLHGQRTSMTDALNHTWTYSYDSLGRLVNTTDPLHHVTHNEYDVAGRLTRVTQNYNPGKTQNQDNEWNIVTTYQYGARGNRTLVMDTFGRRTHYAYDNANRLVTTTDPAGNITTNTYDNAGHLISTTDALGRMTQYKYNAAGKLTKIIDPMGNSTSAVYNPKGTVASATDVLGRKTSYVYDSLKRVITVKQHNGGQTHNTYDELGNLITTTDALGNITRYEYDALGRLIKTIDPLGNFTETFYDEAGRVVQTKDARGHATTYAYDETGRQTSATDAMGNVTSYQYDALGRRISVTNANGKIVAYAYDERNRVVTITDALGHSSTMTYDALGQTTARADPNHNTVSFAYDVLSRLTSQTDSLNNVTSFTYDNAGNRLSVTDANNHSSAAVYDALNRPVSFSDANGFTNTNGYDGAGNLVTSTDGLGKTTVSIYNALNQPILVSDALGNQTTNAYNLRGELVSTTDAEGVTTAYEYDALRRLTAVIENYKPANQPNNETNVRTEYTYDQNGNRLTIKDGNGHITTFVYDALNRLTSETDPLGHTSAYAYDSIGHRTSMTDANGATTTYTYDDANRLTDIIYGQSSTVHFTYDNGGRRTLMTDSSGTTTWTYNALNQVISVTDPFNKTVSYEYDNIGNRVSLTYPDGHSVSYVYDSGNRLTTVNDSPTGTSQSSVTSYQYDSANRLTNISRPNNVDTAYTYDNANRLLSITHASGMEMLSSFQYLYDKVGNRTQAIETVNNPIAPTPIPTTTFTPTETSTPTLTPTLTPTAGPQGVRVTVQDTDGGAKAGIKVYAFNGTTYTNYSGTTDVNGQATFTLPQGSYRFRADLNGTQFWSGAQNHCDVPGCTDATVTVTNSVLVNVLDTDGAAKAGIKVYAFNGTTYTNYSGTTAVNGQATFTLPQGSYHFRADLNGTQFWSDPSPSSGQNNCAIPSCSSATVTVTKPLTVTVQDTDGVIKSGIKVYAFNGTTYTNYSGTTDVNGQATFTLPQGSYRFRADLNGTQFWSGDQNHCDLPGCTNAVVTVTNGVLVTVQDTDGAAKAGIKVYAFNGTTYTNYSGTTDANGQATFTLPQGSYRFRADLNGTQFWSGASNHCNIPTCGSAAVTLTKPLTVTVQDTNGVAKSGIKVYAFNGATYTNYSGTTDANGQATFTLPQGSYRFRADLNGTQFWSGAQNHCDLPGCANAAVTVTNGVLVTVQDTDGAAKAGIKVYAFNGATYTNYSGTTNANGQTTFTLPQGNYRFRADLNGAQFWSNTQNDCSVPSCGTATVTVTKPLTVTVLDTDSTAKAGIKVYAFNGATYTNYSGTTDANGQATFTLPQGSYRFRADLNGTQFWSGASNHCPLPGCESANVVVTIPLTVSVQTADGTVQAGIKVYAFNGATYTNYSGTTNASGQAVFTLPQGDYRFRADYSGAQYWSGASNHSTLPGCTTVTVTVGPQATNTPTPAASPTLTASPTETSTPTPLAYLPNPNGYFEASLKLPSSFKAQYDVPAYKFQQQNTTTTIDYTYDSLYRLTFANYSTGDFYHYTYDAVGNRLTSSDTSASLSAGQSSVISYQYDEANRLTSADGVNYTWDNNGNLLNDGVNSYAYDSANRLISVNGTSSYTYNGLGDRLSQNGVQYTLDLNAGLTQVLDDGTNTYTYGLGRISQTNTQTEYFLGDALGSVRQLTAGNGEVTLTKSYAPYGEMLSSNGSGTSPFAYTGEQQDASGLTYLRARYYNPVNGRFMSRDTFPGNVTYPSSLNRYSYAGDNPVRYTDPSGQCFDPFTAIICIGVAGALIAGGGNLLYQMQQNGGNWECVDWGDVAMWTGGGAVAGLAIGFSIPMIMASPDSILDLASIAYDVYTGDAVSLALDAGALILPGVTGLGAMSHADEAYDGIRYVDGCNSFSADTEVATNEGEKAISEIKIGDYVLAWNPETGDISFHTVTDTIHHTDEVVIHLTIDDEEIETTPEHPFYVEGKGWVNAKDLKVGDKVRNAKGKTGKVEKITTEETTQEMYNLTVDEAHTFYVGDGQWLVHNTGVCNIIWDTMRQENLTWNDIDDLQRLAEMDIYSAGGRIQIATRGDAAGYVRQISGENRPTVFLTEHADRSTLIHEWTHFDSRRAEGWPTFLSTEGEAQNHVDIYEWQIKNVDAIFGPRGYTPYQIQSWQELLNEANRILGY
jgi:RHS repeat-associated protein